MEKDLEKNEEIVFDFSNCPEIVEKENELEALKDTYRRSYMNYKEGLITVNGLGHWYNPISETRHPLPNVISK